MHFLASGLFLDGPLPVRVLFSAHGFRSSFQACSGNSSSSRRFHSLRGRVQIPLPCTRSMGALCPCPLACQRRHTSQR
jgi:hypothetical protein